MPSLPPDENSVLDVLLLCGPGQRLASTVEDQLNAIEQYSGIERWPRLFGQHVPFRKWSPAVVCLRWLGQCRQVVEGDLIWCFVGKCRVRSSLVVEREVFV